MKYIYLIGKAILVGLLVLCVKTAGAQCTDEYLAFRTVMLDDSEEPLGNPESAAVLDNGRMAIATSNPAAVHLFNDTGRHITQISQHGSGPFEYQSPSIVRTNGRTVYVWDSQQMKLLSFDEDGDSVEEWTHFSQALSDFAVDDEALFGYRSGIRSGAFVTGQTMETGEERVSTGETTDEHVVLSLLDGSGTIRAIESNLYFGSPAQASIYAYDVESGNTQVYDIEDHAFSVDEFEPGIEAINSDREAVINYLTENSRFYKLNVLPDQSLLAVLQHGDITYDNEGLSDFDRVLNVHHLSEDGEALACEQIELKFEQTGDDPIIGYTSDGFIFLETEQDSGDLTYRIYLMSSDDASNH